MYPHGSWCDPWPCLHLKGIQVSFNLPGPTSKDDSLPEISFVQGMAKSVQSINIASSTWVCALGQVGKVNTETWECYQAV